MSGRVRPTGESSCLPASVGALVNLAASLSGGVSVNLNYTAGRAGMASMIRQAELSTIISSRMFVEKGRDWICRKVSSSSGSRTLPLGSALLPESRAR